MIRAVVIQVGASLSRRRLLEFWNVGPADAHDPKLVSRCLRHFRSSAVVT